MVDTRRAVLAAALAVIGIVGCVNAGTDAARSSGSPAQSATATARPTDPPPSQATTSTGQPGATTSSADLIAVAKQIYPYSSQYGYYVVCGANGDLSSCPVTDRLKTYLTQKQTTLCGCQNPAPSMDATASPSSTGGVAHVVLGYQPTPLRFDLVIIPVAGRLLVDDQLCTGGGPSSSIYVRSGGC